MGKGAYGYVFGAVDRANGDRLAVKSVDVLALLNTRDRRNSIGRLQKEVAVQSYLTGHPNVRAWARHYF